MAAAPRARAPHIRPRAGASIALLALVLVLVLSGCEPDARYYADGVRRTEGRISFRHDGRSPAAAVRETGPWTWWYPNGERREQGTLEHGRRIGVWIQWYPNAQRRSQGVRAWNAALRASPREGLWTFWHENGEVLARGVFRAGRREGHWDYSLGDGTLDGDRTGEYCDDRPVDDRRVD